MSDNANLLDMSETSRAERLTQYIVAQSAVTR